MRYLATTYRTLSGVKEILETPEKKETEWVIYQDNQPKYFVDVFDIKQESNSMMNSLILCARKSINETLKLINKKNNINLYIPKASRIGLSVKLKSEKKEIYLAPLPEEWLAYSL
jgi:hypothetical protein